MTSRSMACPDKIAASTREPSNAALASTRVRMAWTRPDISAPEPQRPGAVPGQRPGRAAAAPVQGSEQAAAGPDLLRWGSVHLPYPGTSRTGPAPGGQRRRAGQSRPSPGPETAGRQPQQGPGRAARPHAQAARTLTGLGAREELEHRTREISPGSGSTRCVPATPEARSPSARKTDARPRKYPLRAFWQPG